MEFGSKIEQYIQAIKFSNKKGAFKPLFYYLFFGENSVSERGHSVLSTLLQGRINAALEENA